jgi:CheY-like chemotaxis protein
LVSVHSDSFSCRVLEVDDDHDVADSNAMLLRCLGADVRVAYSGEAALAMVPQFKPHLVITDIGMPGMDGCATARRIRALPEGKNLVLAALTAWDQDPIRDLVAKAGFDHFFVKPIKLDALETLLASLKAGADAGAQLVELRRQNAKRGSADPEKPELVSPAAPL